MKLIADEKDRQGLCMFESDMMIGESIVVHVNSLNDKIKHTFFAYCTVQALRLTKQFLKFTKFDLTRTVCVDLVDELLDVDGKTKFFLDDLN